MIRNTISDSNELFILIVDNRFQQSAYWAGDASGLDGAPGAGFCPISAHSLYSVGLLLFLGQ